MYYLSYYIHLCQPHWLVLHFWADSEHSFLFLEAEMLSGYPPSYLKDALNSCVAPAYIFMSSLKVLFIGMPPRSLRLEGTRSKAFSVVAANMELPSLSQEGYIGCFEESFKNPSILFAFNWEVFCYPLLINILKLVLFILVTMVLCCRLCWESKPSWQVGKKQIKHYLCHMAIWKTLLSLVHVAMFLIGWRKH